MSGRVNVLRVGVLRSEGGRSRFEAAPGPFALKVNEDAALQVVWNWKEASRAKEACRIVFALALEGGAPVLQEARIADKPGVEDDAWGTLVHPIRLRKRGDVRATWSVETYYERSGWTGRSGEKADFRAGGDLVLSVL